MSVYNTIVRETQSQVERLGMDENWVDVTSLVEKRIKLEEVDQMKKKHELINVYGIEKCDTDGCECSDHLYVGGIIAQVQGPFYRTQKMEGH